MRAVLGLLIADRNFYSWQDWCAATGSGAALLWRVEEDLQLPVLELLPDSSSRSLPVSPEVTGAAQRQLIEAARNVQDLDPAKARHVRAVEYEVPDRNEADRPGHHDHGPPGGPRCRARGFYHRTWEHGGANAQLKTFLRAGEDLALAVAADSRAGAVGAAG